MTATVARLSHGDRTGDASGNTCVDAVDSRQQTQHLKFKVLAETKDGEQVILKYRIGGLVKEVSMRPEPAPSRSTGLAYWQTEPVAFPVDQSINYCYHIAGNGQLVDSLSTGIVADLPGSAPDQQHSKEVPVVAAAAPASAPASASAAAPASAPAQMRREEHTTQAAEADARMTSLEKTTQDLKLKVGQLQTWRDQSLPKQAEMQKRLQEQAQIIQDLRVEVAELKGWREQSALKLAEMQKMLQEKPVDSVMEECCRGLQDESQSYQQETGDRVRTLDAQLQSQQEQADIKHTRLAGSMGLTRSSSRPTDVTTIKLELEAPQTLTAFGVIVNKVAPKLHKRKRLVSKTPERDRDGLTPDEHVQSCLQKGLTEEQKCGFRLHYNVRDDDLENAEHEVMKISPEFEAFVYSTPSAQICKEDVKNVNADSHDELRDKYETELSELRQSAEMMKRELAANALHIQRMKEANETCQKEVEALKAQMEEGAKRHDEDMKRQEARHGEAMQQMTTTVSELQTKLNSQSEILLKQAAERAAAQEAQRKIIQATEDIYIARELSGNDAFSGPNRGVSDAVATARRGGHECLVMLPNEVCFKNFSAEHMRNSMHQKGNHCVVIPRRGVENYVSYLVVPFVDRGGNDAENAVFESLDVSLKYAQRKGYLAFAFRDTGHETRVWYKTWNRRPDLESHEHACVVFLGNLAYARSEQTEGG